MHRHNTRTNGKCKPGYANWRFSHLPQKAASDGKGAPTPAAKLEVHNVSGATQNGPGAFACNPGAKPAAFCRWIFDWLNMQPGDEFVDLFPGSGAVQAAYDAWLASETGVHQLLFEGPTQ